MAGIRFEGIDFSECEVKEMDTDQEDLGQGFKCVRNDFATYIKGRKIRLECKSLTSKCWVVEHDRKIAGYITLMADKLTAEYQLLKDEGVGYKTFPAVKIGWLAADKRAKGAGRRLLEWALQYITTDLTNRLGVRFVTVDALYDPDTGYDIAGYYERFGFRHVNPVESVPPAGNFRTMYFDIKTVVDELALLGQPQP